MCGSRTVSDMTASGASSFDGCRLRSGGAPQWSPDQRSPDKPGRPRVREALQTGSLRLRQRRSPHRCPRCDTRNRLSKSAGTAACVSETLAPPSQLVGSPGPAPLHGALGVCGRPQTESELGRSRRVQRVSRRLMGRAPPATPGSVRQGCAPAAIGLPALDVERLAALHDGEQQRHQLPGDRADALGLEP